MCARTLVRLRGSQLHQSRARGGEGARESRLHPRGRCRWPQAAPARVTGGQNGTRTGSKPGHRGCRAGPRARPVACPALGASDPLRPHPACPRHGAAPAAVNTNTHTAGARIAGRLLATGASSSSHGQFPGPGLRGGGRRGQEGGRDPGGRGQKGAEPGRREGPERWGGAREAGRAREKGGARRMGRSQGHGRGQGEGRGRGWGGATGRGRDGASRERIPSRPDPTPGPEKVLISNAESEAVPWAQRALCPD